MIERRPVLRVGAVRIVMLRLVNGRHVMGRYVSGRVTHLLSWTVVARQMLLTVILLVTTLFPGSPGVS